MAWKPFGILALWIILLAPGSAYALSAAKKPDPSPSEVPGPAPSSSPIPASPEPVLSPSSSPSPDSPEFKEPLWHVEEGFVVSVDRLVIDWRAEKTLKQTTLTRWVKSTPPDNKVIVIREADEVWLRERIAKLAMALPKRPVVVDKSKCLHWMELETLYGKRFYCEGEDAEAAFEFVKSLHELAKTQ